ncbi:protein phosphatase, partial [Modestobacter sp. VKM Ac-2676]
MDPWGDGEPGVLVLPSGRRVRGRGLRQELAPGPAPGFGVYLLGRPPCPVPWET